MKKILVPVILCILVSPAFAQKKPKAPAKPATPQQTTERPIQSLLIGSQIPNGGYMMQGTKAELISLDQAKTEKGLIVMFSCNTCPYVVKAQKRTLETIALAKENGVGMVILNSNEAKRRDDDSHAAMIQYSIQERYSVPYLRDDASQMADLFGATRTPETFLFDGTGKLVYKGAMEDNPSLPEKSTKFYLADAVKAMVNNQPILTTETKSIGCSIKRLN